MMLGMWWEIGGFVAGAACVWLYVRQSMWAWPVGIVNSACWLVLFWTSKLYLDSGLQVVYIALGIAGWYWWLRGVREPQPSIPAGDATGNAPEPATLPVSRTTKKEAAVLVAVGTLVTLTLWRVMVAVGDAQPLADAATTTVSLIAQYMLIRKLIENWWCWIAVDIAYVAMYSSQGLHLTAALQPLFIAMCVMGLRQWRASLRERYASPVPVTA
jgi:nicotinamide mononucleotide transporter